jgi:hypothetical protein
MVALHRLVLVVAIHEVSAEKLRRTCSLSDLVSLFDGGNWYFHRADVLMM